MSTNPIRIQKAKLFGAVWMPFTGLRMASMNLPVLTYHSAYLGMFVFVTGLYAILISAMELGRRFRRADQHQKDNALADLTREQAGVLR